MKLREYLEKNNIVHSNFAKKLGLKRSAFSRYVNGSRKIPLEIQEKIIKESKGAVTIF